MGEDQEMSASSQESESANAGNTVSKGDDIARRATDFDPIVVDRSLSDPDKSDVLQTRFQCSRCSSTFSNKSNMFRHVSIVHDNLHFACSECGKKLKSKSTLKLHLANLHRITTNPIAPNELTSIIPERNRRQVRQVGNGKVGDDSGNMEQMIRANKFQRREEKSSPTRRQLSSSKFSTRIGSATGGILQPRRSRLKRRFGKVETLSEKKVEGDVISKGKTKVVTKPSHPPVIPDWYLDLENAEFKRHMKEEFLRKTLYGGVTFLGVTSSVSSETKSKTDLQLDNAREVDSM